MSLTRAEQETIINYNQDETTASIYTCDPVLIRRLNKLCDEHSVIAVEKQDEYSKTYKLPKKWIKIKPPRVLSEEQRQKLAERAKNNFGR